jgi:hypothetical protein
MDSRDHHFFSNFTEMVGFVMLLEAVSNLHTGEEDDSRMTSGSPEASLECRPTRNRRSNPRYVGPTWIACLSTAEVLITYSTYVTVGRREKIMK